MSSEANLQRRYEYRLILRQVLFMPTALLTACVLSAAVLGLGVYYAASLPRTSYVGLCLTAFALLVFLSSCGGLFYLYRLWTRSSVSLEFTKVGLKHNFGGSEKIMAYENLRVERGLIGTSIVRTLEGNFIVVPKSIVPTAELKRAIEAGKAKMMPEQKKPKIDFQFFWLLLGVQLLLVLSLIAPMLLGRYFGHGWGLLAAVADIAGWFYIDRMYLRKGALSTRFIWFLGLAGIVFMVVFEGVHFFR